MRLNLVRATSAALVLLLLSPALAQAGLSPKARCENAKLRATSTYTSCLLRVVTKDNTQGKTPSQSEFALCDAGFDRAFEQAEAGGACYTPGGAATVREQLKAEILKNVHSLAAGVTCTINTTEGIAVCQVDKTTSAVDLSSIIQNLSGYGVTNNTMFWIQAWGGNGSNGNVCCQYGGKGGEGGYAQTTTTLNALQNAFNNKTTLYYYLGINGTFAANAGGDGGTATLVTMNNLSTGTAVSVPDTLLIAGGGGGGGAGRGSDKACMGNSYVFGEAGGVGGTALFLPTSGSGGTSLSIVMPGQDGANHYGQDVSGQGGQTITGGAGNQTSSSSATSGGNPTAPVGGAGGNHTNPQNGFTNASLAQVTTAGGQGSNGGNDAGGGGGGGGYTGGGGGNRGVSYTDCTSGGGGGGSSFAREVPDSPTCLASPVTRPDNPNGDQGFVQITVDIGACESAAGTQ